MTTILQHTPAWVYGLFIFLIYRGIQGLRPRDVTWFRMLFLPILFFIWAAISIYAELNGVWISYTAFGGGVFLGTAVGWMFWKNRGGVTFDSTTRLIRRPGSAWTLALVLVGFTAKFVLSVMLARNQSLSGDASFEMLFGGTSGIVDGLFWGGTLSQLWRVKDALFTNS